MKRTAFASRMFAVGSLVAALTAGLPAQPAVAMSPYCTDPNRPTAIGGPIYGFGGNYNNWSIQAQVGMDLSGDDLKKRTVSGGYLTTTNDATGSNLATYSHSDYVNRGLGQPGAASGYERTWGLEGSTGYLCVHSSITKAFFEIYPKINDANGDQITDKRYYGQSVEQHYTITPGATNTITLRLPTGDPYGGNTGDLNGYITYQGHRVDPAALTSFRVWPNDIGPTCGVQGGAFSASTVAYSNSLDATYYNITYLAGGQCGATSQSYDLTVKCVNVCGAASVTKAVRGINIADGTRPRVDIAF